MKLKWYLIIGAALVVFIIIYVWSGGASKIWKQAHDNIVQDQRKVVKTMEDNQAMYEGEITRLYGELKKLQADKVVLQKQKEELISRDMVKNAEIERLRAERKTIVVPTDPAALSDELRRMGYGSTRYRTR